MQANYREIWEQIFKNKKCHAEDKPSLLLIHYQPMQWHCILLFPGPGMFAIRAPEEESSEMVEEMDTSEAVWCWYYLAECGVWHMFEVQDISLHLCIPHPSFHLIYRSIPSLFHPSILPFIASIHPPIPSLTLPIPVSFAICSGCGRLIQALHALWPVSR